MNVALSPRESEVAALVSRRMTDAEIARVLGVSRWTVVEYVRRIRAKLAVWPVRLRGRHAGKPRKLNCDMRAA